MREFYPVRTSLLRGARFTLRLSRADQKGNIFSSPGSQLFDVSMQLSPQLSEDDVELCRVGSRDRLGTQFSYAVITAGGGTPDCQIESICSIQYVLYPSTTDYLFRNHGQARRN